MVSSTGKVLEVTPVSTVMTSGVTDVLKSMLAPILVGAIKGITLVGETFLPPPFSII